MANLWQKTLFYLGLVDEDESAPEMMGESSPGTSGVRYRETAGGEEPPVTVYVRMMPAPISTPIQYGSEKTASNALPAAFICAAT